MIEAGQLVAGRYRVHSPIGEGAMASVWRAHDETLQREVAIKFLYVKGSRNPRAMVEQFLREARIAASVQHRNVIQTVDFGALDDLQPFMVMELLGGETLADRLDRKPPLETQQVVDLVSLTLRGLSAVHDAGIVHRDLKPANIFLQREAESVYPKILDFGISRSLRERDERPSAIETQDGMIVGTPDYMSPEQARGDTDIDKRSDIYSMGVILYRGLTGRLPFISGTVGDLLVQILTATPPSVRDLCPQIDPALSAVVEQSMTRDREDRFADAKAMRRALRGAMKRSLLPGRRVSADSLVMESEDDATRGVESTPGRATAPAAIATGTPAAQPGGWGDIEAPSNAPRGAPAQQPSAPPAMAGAIATSGPPPAVRPASAASPAARVVPRASDGKPAAHTGSAAPVSGGAAGPGASAPDMLNPLYRGRDLPALDIDYDRVKADRGKDRIQVPDSVPRAPRAAGKAHATSRGAPARAPSAPERVPARSSRGAVTLWLFALAALGLTIYFLANPHEEAAVPKIAPAAPSARPLTRSRRANLKDVPPHLRDVRF